MKALSAPESPKQRSMRRVSKPVMEKRRRERINHSLETLRVLMLENTHNEKLKNPKVEKAEILESVVEFLKTEKEVGHQAVRRVLSKPTNNYRDGVRSCLLRVSHFVASKSQESGGSGGDPGQGPFTLPRSQTGAGSSGHLHGELMPAAPAGGGPAALSPQHLPLHPYLMQAPGFHSDTRMLLTSTAAPTHTSDPVWRPWPQ